MQDILSKQQNLFHGNMPIVLDTTIYKSAHFTITGSPDGYRTPKAKNKAKAPREIPNAPIHVISEPATTTAITGAHVGDTEVVEVKNIKSKKML